MYTNSTLKIFVKAQERLNTTPLLHGLISKSRYNLYTNATVISINISDSASEKGERSEFIPKSIGNTYTLEISYFLYQILRFSSASVISLVR